MKHCRKWKYSMKTGKAASDSVRSLRRLPPEAEKLDRSSRSCPIVRSYTTNQRRNGQGSRRTSPDGWSWDIGEAAEVRFRHFGDKPRGTHQQDTAEVGGRHLREKQTGTPSQGADNSVGGPR